MILKAEWLNGGWLKDVIAFPKSCFPFNCAHKSCTVSLTFLERQTVHMKLIMGLYIKQAKVPLIFLS